MKTYAKKFNAHISFVFTHEVSPEEVQQAMLRAFATPAFTIPGQVTIDLVTPQDEPNPVIASIIGKTIGKMAP